MVGPDRSRAQGRSARGTGLDRIRPRERDDPPHLHGHRAGSVRRAVLHLPAGPNAEAPTRRTEIVAQGRVPGLVQRVAVLVVAPEPMALLTLLVAALRRQVE